MTSKEPSRTALMSAIARGLHRLNDPRPWVFDDPFALSLVGPGWPQIRTAMTKAFREPVLRQAMAAMINRARYIEDRLDDGEFAQYVILGAGLDSFAWRRPDLLHSIRLYELDQPATQAWKRDRVDVLALPVNDNHIFVPADFETRSLREILDGADFDWTRPTLFSWLGVTQYLTWDAIVATLKTIAGCIAGTEIVTSYILPREFLDELGTEFVDTTARVAGERGELVQSLFSPTDAERLLHDAGLTVSAHPTRDELQERYFAGRTDGLTIPTTQRLIVGRVG